MRRKLDLEGNDTVNIHTHVQYCTVLHMYMFIYTCMYKQYCTCKCSYTCTVLHMYMFVHMYLQYSTVHVHTHVQYCTCTCSYMYVLTVLYIDITDF